MRAPKDLFFKTACVLLILVGISHLSAHFIQKQPANPAEAMAKSFMETRHEQFAGGSMSIMDIVDGLNLCYALFIIFAGAVNFFVVRRSQNRALLNGLSIISAIAFAAACVIAIAYFIWVHVLYFGLISGLFALSFRREKTGSDR